MVPRGTQIEVDPRAASRTRRDSPAGCISVAAAATIIMRIPMTTSISINVKPRLFDFRVFMLPRLDMMVRNVVLVIGIAAVARIGFADAEKTGIGEDVALGVA